MRRNPTNITHKGLIAVEELFSDMSSKYVHEMQPGVATADHSISLIISI